MSIERTLDFSLSSLPRIWFGPGKFSLLSSLCSSFGKNILLVTGRSALQRSGRLEQLFDEFRRIGMHCSHLTVDREPSPELIDRAVGEYRERGINVVIAVGGGSVLDAGKAVSAMLLQRHSVERFIEGQDGNIIHDGRKVPFIAVPTTSGTGSEVTNNAVISRVGPGGYKRSLRHPNFVPDIALLDPELMLSVSPELTASSGMDACTQLLEAALSPLASPYTDAVAFSGLDRFSRSFMAACGDGAGDAAVRGDIAYAALMSGIALVNAGLGIVHGFASSVGGLFEIPHGTLCATLLAEATRENIRQLELESDVAAHAALLKFAKAGELLSRRPSSTVQDGCQLLLETLFEWQESLRFPRLSAYGIRAGHLDSIVEVTRSKTNPVALDPASMKRILTSRL